MHISYIVITCYFNNKLDRIQLLWYLINIDKVPTAVSRKISWFNLNNAFLNVVMQII